MLTVIIGQAHIQRLAGMHRGGQRAHGFLQWGVGIHAVVVEDVHIVQAHALQALIQAGQQILPAAPLAIGPGPHLIARLGGDDQLVTVCAQILL